LLGARRNAGEQRYGTKVEENSLRDSKVGKWSKVLSLSLSLSRSGKFERIYFDAVPRSFNGGIQEEFPERRRPLGHSLEEAFSRSVKIGKVLARVNSLLKRLFLTRNCLKLVYTRTGGTSEIDSPPPPYGIPPNAFNFSSRLRFIPNGPVNDSLSREGGPPALFSLFGNSSWLATDPVSRLLRKCGIRRALFVRENEKEPQLEINISIY